MASPLAGDTVKRTKTSRESPGFAEREEMSEQTTRKRRRLEFSTGNTVIPEKAQRREEKFHCEAVRLSAQVEKPKNEIVTRSRPNRDAAIHQRGISKSPINGHDKIETQPVHKEQWPPNTKSKRQEQTQQTSRKQITGPVRDEAARLRKTIQWLEEGGRRLREDLANVRTELHEERRASKIARRETEAAIREARASEAAKYQMIITDLKTRLTRSSAAEASIAANTPSSTALKMEFMKEEHHKREISALKKRLSETETTIRNLKWELLNQQAKVTCRAGGPLCAEARRLEAEVRNLRGNYEKIEEKLRIAQEAEKARIVELRIQHENHEAQLSSLRNSLRNKTIKMMDELREKNREIEKLSKLTQAEGQRKRKKTQTKDDIAMRKLQGSERAEPIRSVSRVEKKFLPEEAHTVDSYMHEDGCDRAITEIEVERLRELALEQQEVIEILRQAVKEKERKLEQLSNKRRKEEFYRQWLELEPVVEVDDEEDHEEGDSALSSAPSSLSPQPGGCGQWQGNGVTREAYEAVLVEIEELQTKLFNERQELSLARNQVRDLEKALLQEARCENRNKELNAINEKLRMTEEREAMLLVELSELREQNELLEFRLLELEETSARRGSPDHTADSGIVSPEPMHASKDQLNKQRNRAIATVIPYTNSTNLNSRSVSPQLRKPPLSLQESGIFEEDVDDEDSLEVQLSSRGTQTEVPAGELLQEVQRLQELRARIQERVSNPVLCPIDQTKINMSLESVNDISDESIDQLPSYQERIRELEERLKSREEEVENRLEEKRLSKQREEDLLDENYRLTEKVYWLENELKNSREKAEEHVKNCRNDMKNLSIIQNQIQMEFQPESTMEIFVEKNSNFTENIQFDGRKEMLVKEVQTIPIPNEFLCPICQNNSNVVEQKSSVRWSTKPGMEDVLMDVEEVGKEAKEQESSSESSSRRGSDELDNPRSMLTESVGTVSQVFLVPEEGSAELVSPEAEVSITETESEKKSRGRQGSFGIHSASKKTVEKSYGCSSSDVPNGLRNPQAGGWFETGPR